MGVRLGCYRRVLSSPGVFMLVGVLLGALVYSADFYRGISFSLFKDCCFWYTCLGGAWYDCDLYCEVYG